VFCSEKVFKEIHVKSIVKGFKGFDDVGFQTIMWMFYNMPPYTF